MAGYIARLSQWGGGQGEYFTRSNDFYLPSLRLGGGGRQHPVGETPKFISLWLCVCVSTDGSWWVKFMLIGMGGTTVHLCTQHVLYV